MMYRACLWSWVILMGGAIVRLFSWVLIRVGWCRMVIIFIGRFSGMFVGIGWWAGLVLVVGCPMMVGGGGVASTGQSRRFTSGWNADRIAATQIFLDIHRYFYGNLKR